MSVKGRYEFIIDLRMNENEETNTRDESCNCCWSCCSSNNHSKNDKAENEDELNRSQNMSISFIYLLSLLTGASSLAIAFWIERIELHWLHIFIIGLTAPAFVGFAVSLACRTNLSENSQPAKSHCYRRSYIIALIPCCLAVLFLDVVRFVSYIQSNKTIKEIVFTNLKIFYAAFQVLFVGKYLGKHLEENLISRIFLMHLVGTNIFLWFYEYSKHSSQSLDFSSLHYHESHVENNTNLTLRIIEASEPYIYPLVIQFMIIMSVALYQIWLNMRSFQAKTQDIYIDDDYGEIRPARNYRTLRYLTGPITHSDLMQTNIETSGQKSISLLSCGLYLGSFIFVGLVFSGLLLLSNRIDRDTAIIIYYSYQVALFLSMIIACILCLKNLPDEPTLIVADLDILIFISMLSYLLYAEFSFVSSFTNVFSQWYSTLMFFISLTRIIQCLIQTFLISKAFRNGLGSSNHNCCSAVINTLIFLLFANAALWVTESIFDLRIAFVAPVQSHYFGDTLWRSIKFALFPLCILFRYTSCTSLLEIILWSDDS